MKPSLFLAAVLLLVLSACGAPAAPAIDPAMVQASAVAAASTMVALTQAALPTDTPTAAPSPTALPSPTPAPLPTLPPSIALPTVVSAPTTASGGDQGGCVHALSVAEAGPTHRTLIINQSGATVNISLTLYTPNKFGQCGSISYANLAGSGSVMANLPEGNWNAYAWATGKGKTFTVSGSFFVQPAQFDKLELCVRTNLIRYTPQC
ncbi:MAG TPA: hypothetical protein VF784_10225 [Anaerolineales bacterium]